MADTRKAALWSALAGVAQLLIVFVGALGYPYLYDILLAIAYGFMLPGIAVLHVRHARVRESGAFLGTIAGVAVAILGISGSANLDVRPAALFVLGMWWWTIGKLWTQTAVLPRAFGVGTAALAMLAFALVPLESLFGEQYFTAGHAILGLWLIVLAWIFVARG